MQVDEVNLGYVSDLTINEVFHKLMLAEVSKTFDVKPLDVIPYIKRNFDVISKLKILWEEMEIIQDSRINIIPVGRLFPDFMKPRRNSISSPRMQ